MPTLILAQSSKFLLASVNLGESYWVKHAGSCLSRLWACYHSSLCLLLSPSHFVLLLGVVQAD